MLCAVASPRCVAVAETRETAIEAALETAEASAAMCENWQMQESSMVDLGLSSKGNLSDWAIVGSPKECMEVIGRCQ